MNSSQSSNKWFYICRPLDLSTKEHSGLWSSWEAFKNFFCIFLEFYIEFPQDWKSHIRIKTGISIMIRIRIFDLFWSHCRSGTAPSVAILRLLELRSWVGKPLKLFSTSKLKIRHAKKKSFWLRIGIRIELRIKVSTIEKTYSPVASIFLFEP